MATQGFKGGNTTVGSGLLKGMPTKRQGAGVAAGGIEPLPLPEPGFIRLRAIAHDNVGLVAELDGPVTAPSGYGTHDIVDRPQRVGITTYHGRAPLTLRIPLLFDRWTTQASVEPEITLLETLFGIRQFTRPPQIIVEGFGVPHSYSRDASLRWVLSGDPEWGDDIRFLPVGGHRTFVQVVVNALQVSLPSTVTEPAPPKGRAAPRKHVRSTSTLNTLRKIAKHNKLNWHTLRTLNPRLPADPDKSLKAGTKVRVR
jgi:hypothetical protein